VAGRHQAVPRNGVEAHIGGEQQRLFELVFLLRQAEVDLVAGRLIERRQRTSQIADRLEPASERRRCVGCAAAGKCLPRLHHRGRNGVEAGAEIRGRIRGHESQQAAQAGIDTVENLALAARDAAVQHGVAQAIGANAAGTHESAAAGR
jgi:hypothetical protein